MINRKGRLNLDKIGTSLSLPINISIKSYKNTFRRAIDSQIPFFFTVNVQLQN